jgi:hypothetical protein
MLTLTYAPGVQWAAGHVTEFIKRVREWAARQRLAVFAYVWCAEMQSRGAVHYHVLVWLPRRVTLPKPDKRGWWCHGMTRTERARNAVGYIAKYVSKLETKLATFPRSLRLQASGGLNERARCERRWWAAPSWARDEVGAGKAWPPGVDLRKRAGGGGGYVRIDTGELFLSPWEFAGAGGAGLEAYVRLVYVGGKGDA